MHILNHLVPAQCFRLLLFYPDAERVIWMRSGNSELAYCTHDCMIISSISERIKLLPFFYVKNKLYNVTVLVITTLAVSISFSIAPATLPITAIIAGIFFYFITAKIKLFIIWLWVFYRKLKHSYFPYFTGEDIRKNI